jgi:UPF0716 protein FxsA
MPILLTAVLWVAAEIATLIAVGGALGVLPTLLLLGATTAGGLALVRYLGLDLLRRAEAVLARGEAPVDAVFDGICLLLAGLLLAAPGFLSDVVALGLLLRPLRRAVGGFLWRRLQGSPDVRVWASARAQGEAIDADYVVVRDDPQLPPPPPPPEKRE